MSVIFEPFVDSQIFASTTNDNAGYSSKNLLVAAPLVSDYGPRDIMLVNNQKELLNLYRPEGKKYLEKDLDDTFFQIYLMLQYSSVLVLRVTDEDDSIPTSISSLATDSTLTYGKLFGHKLTVAYQGKIGLGDNGESYLIDHKDRLIDTYAKVKVGSISAQSIEYQELVSALYKYNEDNQFGHIYVYGYRYDQDDNLELSLVYKYVEGINDHIQTILKLPNIDGLPTGPNKTLKDDYRILLQSSNPTGLTITNSGTYPLSFKVINISPTINTFSLKINSQLENDDATLAVVETSRSGQKIKLSPEINVSASGNGVKLTGDESDDKLLKATDTTFIFKDPFRGNLDESALEDNKKSGERVALMQKAINSLLDYEGGYRVDFIWDSGEGDPGLHGTMNQVAKHIRSFALCSVDNTSVKTVDELISKYDNNKEYVSYRLTPYVNYNFGVKTMNVSPMIDYVGAVSRNKGVNSEFAPVFGLNNGAVPSSKLTKYFKIKEREKLIGSRINSLKYDQFRNATTINDTATGETSQSLFNEEWIVRMANRISWDVDFLLEQFLGRYDVETTALEVKSVIDLYFKRTITNQTYKPEHYEIICDGSNNVYGDGELLVEINVYVGRALRKITVYTKMLPLSALTAQQANNP